MKHNVDDLVRDDMNEKQELPASIRSAFEQSYEQIRQQTKPTKSKKSWLKPITVAAATVVLSSTILLTNDAALAKLQAFFGLGDPGIEIASRHGDVQSIGQVQQDESITMMLNNLFIDAYRMGMQFTIESEHIKKGNIYEVSYEYRLYDADGNPISALISDTKDAQEIQMYTGTDFHLVDVQDKAATIEMVAIANSPQVPSLEGAKLVVETIHISQIEGGIVSVGGKWQFDFTSPMIVNEQYEAKNSIEGIQLKEALITNGSMYITFMVDQEGIAETNALNTSLLNEQGKVFTAQSSSIKELDEQTEVSLIFPYSAWNAEQTLSLKVEGYETLNLVKQK